MTLLAIPTGLLLLTPICSNARADDSFVDPHRKAVGLTLRRELVEQAPAAEIAGALPLVGTLFPEATVARIDGSTGMLLNLGAPEGADAAAVGPIGYVHVSNASDKYVERLDKEFKAGQVVTGRVIAQRSADGLVSVSLKEGVVTQAKLGIRDCVAGESLEGKVESVTERGVVVRITDAITGFCPRLHCSDAPNELSQTAMAKKFAEGAKLKWRVLVADAAKNKLIVTARRSLLASKAEPLAQLDDAQEGAKYAGVVANVQSFGVFIEFFGNVRGLAHRSQLGLLPSQEPSEVFERGAPVRATVLSVDMRKRQLSLSLAASKKAANASAEAAAGLESFEQGDVVQAVVRSAASKSSTLTLAVDICAEDADPAAEGAVTARAILPCGHLSEAEDVSAGALELFREGDELGFPCVVLDKDSGKGLLRVSAKPSLVAAARRGELPYTTDDVRPGDLLDGYVASVTPTAVFVRCGDRCTGYVPSSRAMERQAPDAPRLSLTGLYARDQSVLVRVAEVDAGANKFTGSLLPSAVAAEASRAAHGVASSVAWMRRGAALALRVKEEGLRGAKVQLSETEKLEERWCARFPLGKRFSGEVVEEMEQGVVVKVDAAKEVLFFLSADATGGVEAPAKGEEVELRVIDANVAEGIVDVTSAAVAMPDEPAAGKKKASKKKGAVKGEVVPLAKELEATVVVARKHFAVLRLPGASAPLAWAAPSHPNALLSPKALVPGDSVRCVVTELASADSGHRTLAVLLPDESASPAARTGGKGGSTAARALVEAGDAVAATVVSCKGVWVEVSLPDGLTGRCHVSDLPPPAVKSKEQRCAWWDPEAKESPMGALEAGAALKVMPRSVGRQGDVLVSARAAASKKATAAPESVEAEDIVHGYVDHLEDGSALVALSPSLKGRLAAIDAFPPEEEGKIKDMSTALRKGQHVLCRVLAVGETKSGATKVDLTLNLSAKAAGDDARSASEVEAGDVVVGRISRVLSAHGLSVHLGARQEGRVHITDMGDTFTPEPLGRYQRGAVVTVAVMSINDGRVALSLRPSLGGSGVGGGAKVLGAIDSSERIASAGDLAAGDLVGGYVKAISSKGCFVSLGADVDARCVLKHLADAFVSDPADAFPPGKLVKCKVLSASAASGRVEVSLRPSHTAAEGVVDLNARPARPEQVPIEESLAKLKEGDRVEGAVRRVEPYGVFVRLDGTALSGLVHVSEICEAKVENIEAMFKAGERVECAVVGVDQERKRLSLAMANKKKYTAMAKALAKGKPVGGEAVGDEDEGSESEEDLDAMELAEEDEAEESDSGDDSEDEQEFAEAAFEADDDSDEEGEEEESSDEDSDEEDEEDEDLDGMEVDDDEQGAGVGSRMAAVDPLDVDMDAAEDDDADAGAVGGDGQEGGAAEESEAEKKSRRRKEKAKAAREEELRRLEAARVEGQENPASAEDFERLLLANPASAYTWVKYMALHLSEGDAPAARRVAGRALEAIPWRNEADKLAVWTAWLNLENLHGEPDPETATAELFAKACQRTDSKKLHVVLLGIYEDMGEARVNAAERLIGGMCKAFRGSCKIWLRAFEHYLRAGKGGKARATLDKGLASLPRRKHIKAILAAGLLEFRAGSAERARVMLEGILKSYPRRTDVMSVYLDAEIKHGDEDSARALFERATRGEHLTARQAKFLFKRWLEFERKVDESGAGVEHVKASAQEWAATRM